MSYEFTEEQLTELLKHGGTEQQLQDYLAEHYGNTSVEYVHELMMAATHFYQQLATQDKQVLIANPFRFLDIE